MPKIAVKGVLSSWLIQARKSSLTRFGPLVSTGATELGGGSGMGRWGDVDEPERETIEAIDRDLLSYCAGQQDDGEWSGTSVLYGEVFF
jgi:hypothetical protein